MQKVLTSMQMQRETERCRRRNAKWRARAGGSVYKIAGWVRAVAAGGVVRPPGDAVPVGGTSVQDLASYSGRGWRGCSALWMCGLLYQAGDWSDEKWRWFELSTLGQSDLFRPQQATEIISGSAQGVKINDQSELLQESVVIKMIENKTPGKGGG